ncbi:MAG: class I SAM-dependent methyltransferase [Acidimicrobiales bacterium]|nr:class I SAM-dependent methyltransferase [Acidimicrobiales bacterium]
MDAAIVPAVAESVQCRGCAVRYHWVCFGASHGAWQLLRPADRATAERFLADYTHIRRAEGRGSADPAYYRNLPTVPADDPLRWQWSRRERSWRHARARVLSPQGEGRRIVDVGAGVGWLANRLASDGHDVVAVDVSLDPLDGLGAARHYHGVFPCVQAHFDHLPFASGTADIVLFDASLHYSVDYAVTLAEARRVLRSGGCIVVLDSPIYHHDRSGHQMVAERHADFERRFGRRSDTVASRQFLTPHELARLGDLLGLRWERSRPFYGWRWAARPWVARLRRRREPSRFELLVGRV